MKITAEEVAHVARLARLKLSPEQTEKLTGQMNDILSAMDKLREVDTSQVEATSHALELTGAFRQDEAKASLDRAQSLENAPATDGENFVVPRVI